MLFELKIKVEKENKKGELKQVTEHYITDAELFANAEYTGLNEYDGKCDVIAIKRSPIREIVNDKDEDKPFFKATLIDVFVNDDGVEKENRYPVLVCAEDMKEANRIMEEYRQQGLGDLRLDGIVKTKILDVL
ncbi:MAG: DUF4494 family protein [Clostridia bacterium]|nr:DUF4494 family protein [Clostridia bacterium]